jgi:hypothetical protein
MQRDNIMENIIVMILLFLPILLLNSCVKQEPKILQIGFLVALIDKYFALGINIRI